MSRFLIASTLAGVFQMSAAAGVIWSDNFNAPDTGNLDLSEQAGRRAGSNPAIQARSSRVQHGISGNALNFLNAGTGRIRFHEDTDLSNATAGAWFDWASGSTGADILAAGGLSVKFDWITDNTTATEWVAFNIGHGAESGGEPGFRVNDGTNDAGILFRFNGQTEIFDNGTNLGAGGSIVPVAGVRNVKVDYNFTSFADGSPFTMTAYVNGTSVYNNSFTWSGNSGQIYMELETLSSTTIDNLSVSTIPEPSGLLLLGAASLMPVLRRRRNPA